MVRTGKFTGVHAVDAMESLEQYSFIPRESKQRSAKRDKKILVKEMQSSLRLYSAASSTLDLLYIVPRILEYE